METGEREEQEERGVAGRGCGDCTELLSGWGVVLGGTGPSSGGAEGGPGARALRWRFFVGGALAGIPLNWPPEGRPGRKAFGDFHWGALRSVGGEEDARTVRPYNSITDAGLGRGAF